MVKLWLCAIALVVLSCGESARERGGTSANVASSVLPLSAANSYRAMVYTETFGRRFALPSSGFQTLDTGLQAVVIRVVERSGDHPGCFLDLYLDDSLDLAFPEGSEGVVSYPDDENPFFFVHGSSPLGVEEHRWDAMLGSFHTAACRSGSKGCSAEVGGPYAYFRKLVPGVALQTYRMMCDQLDPQQGPTEMWLLRSGQDRTALDPQTRNESGTYRFSMPSELFEHAAPRIRQAVKFYADRPLGPKLPRGQFSVPAAKAR